MGKKMTNEIILDFWNDIVILRIVCILTIILLVFVTIGASMTNKQGNSEERLVRLNKMIDGYMAKDEFMIASIQINKRMTIETLEKLYLQFGKHPTAQAMVSRYINQICEG